MIGILAHSGMRIRVTTELLAGMDIEKAYMTVWMENVPHRIMYLNTWPQASVALGGTVWREIKEVLGVGPFLEEVLHWGSFEGL